MTHTKDESSVTELQRYSPDGEGRMELDILGAYVKLQDVAAQTAPVQPVGALTLGGVIDTSDGPEYEEWDVEWNTKAIEALQEKLVTSDSVTVMIYTAPPAQPAPVQPVAWTDEQLQMLNFLYGAGEWDGLWFDQKHPEKEGKFWWRSDLRRLFTTPPAAQPAVQEPVAWRWTNGKGWLTYGEMQHDKFKSTPLYTTPPAQPTVPLTDEQIESLLPDDDTPMSLGEAFVKFARLVEAHHGITKGQP